MTMTISRDRAEDWALWLTRQPSVTGSAGEIALPDLLAARIAGTEALRGAEVWTIPASDPLRRACLAVLVRGEGSRTVLLTGHFDTVTTSDYGDLEPVATEPHALRGALLRRLATPASAAEALAKEDLASGDFLPGRGLLDMKAGLAAALAVMEAFAARPDRQGNLLFVAVPDEEVNSVGARALARGLPDIAAARGLELLAAINLDCIGDEGDGSHGRSIALGSVGKLLVIALVVGLPAHASHPFQGVNAGALAGAIAARLEWAVELADGSEGEPGIPPVLLSLKDGKQQYDVTTPATVFATWNTLSRGRSASATMAAFRHLVAAALEGVMADLDERRTALLGEAAPHVQIPLIEISSLMASLPVAAREGLDRLGAEIAAAGLSLPDQNQRLTEEAWHLSGRQGPAVVLGFGSLPYPPVSLSTSPRAIALRRATETARSAIEASHGVTVGSTPFFPGISDMSFLGEADTADLPVMIAGTPAWRTGIGWAGEIGGLPTVNIGPWGRAFHTPLERLHVGYAFDVLPALLLRTAEAVFAGDDA